MRDLVAVLFAFGMLTAHVADSRATVYLSNLENRFEGGGIGDIGGVSNNWTPVAAHFTTGAGDFQLNSVTLEFYLGTSDFPPPPYWTNAVVRLYQQRGSESLLLGSLKDPTLNPLSTQWPRPSAMFLNSYTAYVDFHPLSPMILHGLSTYVVEVSDPPISSTSLAFLFSSSSNYTSAGEWRMGATTRPFVTGASFLKLAVDADAVPGHSEYIVPGGITASRHGLGPGELEVHVIQDPTSGDYTCFFFEPQGRDTFAFNQCLDEGVRAFLVSSNAPISLPAIQEQNYSELTLPRAFEPDVPFYVAFYTGQVMLTNGMSDFGAGVYTNAVFGWGKFVTRDDVIEMLDSALEYGGAGIYAGTQTIIAAGENPVLSFVRAGDKLRLWWPMSSRNFVLERTSDLTAASWTEVTSAPTLNGTNLQYEVNLRDSAGGSLFYRLRFK